MLDSYDKQALITRFRAGCYAAGEEFFRVRREREDATQLLESVESLLEESPSVRDAVTELFDSPKAQAQQMDLHVMARTKLLTIQAACRRMVKE